MKYIIIFISSFVLLLRLQLRDQFLLVPLALLARTRALIWMDQWYRRKSSRLFRFELMVKFSYCGLLLSPTVLLSRLLLRMRSTYVASLVWTSTKNEWNAQNAVWSPSFILSITHDLITHILTIYHVQHTQNTMWEQECFDLWLLLPALHNLWSLIVLIYLSVSRHTMIGQE